MKHISLFSGIGGFDLAAEKAGFENIAHCEIEEDKREVLKNNFPNSKSYGDIKEFDGRKYRNTIGIVSGGFPCQDISIAQQSKKLGGAKGIKGKRSGLWKEYARVIRQIRPKVIVFENSPMLLNRGLQNDLCSTLAPILHWRVCNVWDWLKVFAPMPKYGAWRTELLADAYGGDEAEEINARTGCIGCPLVEEDKSLNTILKNPKWEYLRPLKRLKVLYREMRFPKHRLRKNGNEFKKDGKLAKNQYRMGPLTLEARKYFLKEILSIQDEVNKNAVKCGMPEIDILNPEEIVRIEELIELKTFPNKWSGEELNASIPQDEIMYSDGTIMETLFKNLKS
jgi:hypothetical protein